ncbi:MAG: efflux transporter outer membrane subunit [Verrucomicrobiota bacterium]
MPPSASRSLILCLISTAALTSGCRLAEPTSSQSLAPDLARDIPEAWSNPWEAPDKAATGWLADFDNLVLRKLIREAVGKNYDLKAASARIDAAAARVRISGANRLPGLTADLSGSRSQRLRGSNFDKITANQFSAGLNLDWEFDLWGRLKDQRKASVDRFVASDADYQAARLSLAATIPRNAFNLLEAERQIELSLQNLQSLRTNLAILDGRLEAGDFDDRTALDISLSRSDVLRSEAGINANRRLVDSSKRTLETLLGRFPDASLKALAEFPTVKRAVPAGLPVDLLFRRPDLIAAERRVRAATREATATRKSLLPNIRITGNTGTSTTENFSDLLDPKALVWSIAGSLSQQIFQGGRNRANITLSDAQRDELAATFANAVLQAFREVETALSAEKYFVAQQQKLTEATEEADRAEELALSQYEEGLVEIITVLESQRRAFDLRSNLLNVTNQRLQNRIDLYLALGGDFDHAPSIAE